MLVFLKCRQMIYMKKRALPRIIVWICMVLSSNHHISSSQAFAPIRDAMLTPIYRIDRPIRAQRSYSRHFNRLALLDRDNHVRNLAKSSNSVAKSKETVHGEGFFHNSENIIFNSDQLMKDTQNRRLFFSSLLMSSGIAISTIADQPAVADEIQWTASPVNKRSGVSVFKAEETYNLRFITYLSRFLLSFDEECQRWWYKRAGDIPMTATAEEVNKLRLKQFGAFSASVEVGLQEYGGMDGPSLLMNLLLERYGNDIENLIAIRAEKGLPPWKPVEEDRERREIREAKRQIALLFALLTTYQPTEQITKLLASIDNGSIQNVQVLKNGSGYSPGYGSPRVTFPKPEAGDNYEIATGRAILRPNGRILRIDITKRGCIYSKPPSVTISPPIAEAFGSPFAKVATAKAHIFRGDGSKKGKLERIELISAGSGYSEDEPIEVQISPPDPAKSTSGQVCSAKAILEYEVGEIQVLTPGTGYATEKPLEVLVDPPPLTARLNMNDPIVVQTLDLDKSFKSTGEFDPSTTPSKAWQIAKRGGGGGCVGRACYDEAVVSIAYPVAESDSYKSFRKTDESRSQPFEIMKSKRNGKSGIDPTLKAAGDEESVKLQPFWRGGNSSSSQLLSLLPAGIGLVFNTKDQRYVLFAGESVMDYDWADSVSPGKPIDTDFGPRGRSPIERERDLDVSTLLRFFLSGSLCSSSVHLLLTPLDVVKTKIQTKPEKYTDPLTAFQLLSDETGLVGFFAGWIPTFIGFFIHGGVVYTAIEIFRRFFEGIAGGMADLYEIPIILASSFTAAVIGSCTLTPSEAIRIRTVAQPDYAPDAVGVITRMVKEEGFLSLFSALPAFLLKEVPFTLAKFTVFDVSTEYMYDLLPAAREDLRLSLLVSLVGGMLGGVSAALISNPADATISEMKKQKSDEGPIQTFQKLYKENALFRGLGVRMLFYTMVVSLQFLVYDGIRFSLGIGSDDLMLYLDVLGGALREKGGPI